MSLQIANTSKQKVSELILKEFYSIDPRYEYIYGRSEELIKTARDFGLDETAEEMVRILETEQ